MVLFQSSAQLWLDLKTSHIWRMDGFITNGSDCNGKETNGDKQELTI